MQNLEDIQKRFDRLLDYVTKMRSEQKWYLKAKGPVSFEKKRATENKVDDLLKKEIEFKKSGLVILL